MTQYINPSTRHDGANQIIVSKRITPADVYEAPFDDGLYARSNGDWVPVPPIDVNEAPIDGGLYARSNGDWVPIPQTWQSWTPVITGTTTNPTMGNSTVVGRYLQVGKAVTLNIYIHFGSTFNPGGGAYGIPTLPVAPKADYWQTLQVACSGMTPAGDHGGYAKIEGSSGIARIHVYPGGTTVSHLALGGSGTVVATSGGRLLINGTYEAA